MIWYVKTSVSGQHTPLLQILLDFQHYSLDVKWNSNEKKCPIEVVLTRATVFIPSNIQLIEILTETKEQRINGHFVDVEEYCTDEVGGDTQYDGGNVVVV